MRFRKNIIISIGALCIAVLGVVMAFAQAAPEAVSGEARIVQGANDASIKVGDLLDINVFQEKDLSGTYEVDSAGWISFPLIGDVKLAGLSPVEAKAILVGRLTEFILKPQLTIINKRVAVGAVVTLFGQVSKPGTYPLSGEVSLTQLLAKAGDITEVADQSRIRILRNDGSSTKTIVVNLMHIFDGKQDDLILAAGDIIYVGQKAQLKDNGRATILGFVKMPGAYSCYTGMTIMQLLAFAGDFTKEADPTALTLIRTKDDGQREVFKINASRILKGQAEDVAVYSGDVVMVVKDEKTEQKMVNLIGQVRKPGVYECPVGYTLLQLISVAGDFTEMANVRKVKIVRKELDQPKVILVNVRKILSGKMEDVILYPNDVVSIPESMF
jgi:polysaccharide export outer membrane protein